MPVHFYSVLNPGYSIYWKVYLLEIPKVSLCSAELLAYVGVFPVLENSRTTVKVWSL